MTKTLVEELLELQAANNALYTADMRTSKHRSNPPWILEDIDLRGTAGSSEETNRELQREAEKKILARFYTEGYSLRTHREDEKCIEASEARKRAVEELERSEAILKNARREYEEADEQTQHAEENVTEKAKAVASLKVKVDDLNYKLEQAQNRSQERIKKDEADAATDKVITEEKARAAAKEKISEAEASIELNTITAGGVIKWLLIGVVIGSFAASIASSICLAILGDSAIIFPIAIVVGGVATFCPVAKYVSDINKRNGAKRREIETIRKENEQEIEDIRNADNSAKMKEKLQSELNGIGTIKNNLLSHQNRLDLAIEDERHARSTLKDLEAKRATLKTNLNEVQRELEDRRNEVRAAEAKIDDAFEEFVLSLKDEFLAVQAEEREQYGRALARLQLLQLLRQMLFNQALNLQSIGAVYSPNDLRNISRVIDKLQSNRASTLSEALNIVDADLRAERMHAEQMAADRRHNERIEAQKRATDAEMARLERERTEELKRIEEEKVRTLADAERERNRVLAEKAQAELEIQEQLAAQEAEHQAAMERAEQEKLRLQEEAEERQRAHDEQMLREQQAAAEAAASAAAAEEQRLREQQEAYELAEESAAAEQEAFIASNLAHCRNCVHTKGISNYRIQPDAYCSVGGWMYGESNLCDRYRSR